MSESSSFSCQLSAILFDSGDCILRHISILYHFLCSSHLLYVQSLCLSIQHLFLMLSRDFPVSFPPFTWLKRLLGIILFVIDQFVSVFRNTVSFNFFSVKEWKHSIKRLYFGCLQLLFYNCLGIVFMFRGFQGLFLLL